MTVRHKDPPRRSVQRLRQMRSPRAVSPRSIQRRHCAARSRRRNPRGHSGAGRSVPARRCVKPMRCSARSPI